MTDELLPTNHTLRLLRQAIANGWEIPPAALRGIPAYAASIITNPNEKTRERLRAAELLAMLQRDTIAALATLDKTERLDSGQATERIELGAISLNPRRDERSNAETPAALPRAAQSDL